MTYLYLRHSKGQAMSQEHITLLSEQHPDRVFIETDASPDALTPMLEQLESGDCVVAERMADLADNSRAFLELFAALSVRGADLYCVREGLDTRGEAGAAAQALLVAVSALATPDRPAAQRAGIERAREAGKYTGRRPIAVDDNAFSAVVARWRSGEITAKEAMQELGLKPNTFYRRINERKEEAMKDYRKVEKEIREEIKEATRQSQKDLDELKKQVKAEAKELKKNAEETLSLHEVKREMVKDRIRAENEYNSDMRQLKKDVEAEAKELKKLIND